MIRKQGWCVLSCITLITSPVSHFVLVDYEVIKSETLYECRCSWFVFGCEESSTRDLPTFARVIGLAKHRSKSNWERESRTRIACSFPTSESTDLSELPCSIQSVLSGTTSSVRPNAIHAKWFCITTILWTLNLHSTFFIPGAETMTDENHSLGVLHGLRGKRSCSTPEIYGAPSEWPLGHHCSIPIQCYAFRCP